MTTQVDYAIIAGASYLSTRNPENQFPIPKGSGKSLSFYGKNLNFRVSLRKTVLYMFFF